LNDELEPLAQQRDALETKLEELEVEAELEMSASVSLSIGFRRALDYNRRDGRGLATPSRRGREMTVALTK
jgi:hypothetical protein